MQAYVVPFFPPQLDCRFGENIGSPPFPPPSLSPPITPKQTSIKTPFFLFTPLQHRPATKEGTTSFSPLPIFFPPPRATRARAQHCCSPPPLFRFFCCAPTKGLLFLLPPGKRIAFGPPFFFPPLPWRLEIRWDLASAVSLCVGFGVMEGDGPPFFSPPVTIAETNSGARDRLSFLFPDFFSRYAGDEGRLFFFFPS